MKILKILLVDDQAMFREGLRLILSQQADFEIVGEAGDGVAGIEGARRLNPDVILMDLRMPKLGGVEAIRRIRSELPAIRVVVLTTFEEDEEVFAALRAGACGYLLKDSPSDRLGEAVRLAARGESWLQPSVAAKLVSEFGRISPPPLRALAEPLSVREQEVVRLLTQGMSNKEIGRALTISEGTVKNHMSQVIGKLRVLDRTQAALRAKDLGLI